jgi:hypothetical protein
VEGGDGGVRLLHRTPCRSGCRGWSVRRRDGRSSEGATGRLCWRHAKVVAERVERIERFRDSGLTDGPDGRRRERSKETAKVVLGRCGGDARRAITKEPAESIIDFLVFLLRLGDPADSAVREDIEVGSVKLNTVIPSSYSSIVVVLLLLVIRGGCWSLPPAEETPDSTRLLRLGRRPSRLALLYFLDTQRSRILLLRRWRLLLLSRRIFLLLPTPPRSLLRRCLFAGRTRCGSWSLLLA